MIELSDDKSTVIMTTVFEINTENPEHISAGCHPHSLIATEQENA